MPERSTAIRGLAEIAIRVNDLEIMERFYRDVLGLELFKRFPRAAFFRVADGPGGHPQALVLFDRKARASSVKIHDTTPHGVSPERSTLDHLALDIDLAAYDSEKTRLEGLGIEVEAKTFAWVGWRSLFFNDPEGNTVELVCFDPQVLDS